MDRNHGGQNGGGSESSGNHTLESLKQALEEHQVWPSVYMFKFIIPSAELSHLLALLDGLPYTTRDSKSGRFVSVTSEVEMASAEAVVAVYQRAAGIKGLISL